WRPSWARFRGPSVSPANRQAPRRIDTRPTGRRSHSPHRADTARRHTRTRSPHDGERQRATGRRIARRHGPHWQLVPGPALEQAARSLLVRTAPLLEEERDAGTAALIPDVGDPGRIHGPRPRARLATDDHPVDAA